MESKSQLERAVGDGAVVGVGISVGATVGVEVGSSSGVGIRACGVWLGKARASGVSGSAGFSDASLGPPQPAIKTSASKTIKSPNRQILGVPELNALIVHLPDRHN